MSSPNASPDGTAAAGATADGATAGPVLTKEQLAHLESRGLS